MIILPDKNIPRAKILMPVHDREWREPSLAQPKDQFGNQNRTRFILTARLSDGFVKWKGYFECRDDADAFLYSLVCGSLRYEKELWKLPTPYWSPCIDEGVVYDQLLVETIITAPTGSNQTYTRPSDWNQFKNLIQTWGAGGGGARRNGTGVAGAGGAGGGGYSHNNGIGSNQGTVIGATATYQIGALGAGATTINTAGGTGGDTWFNGTVITSCSVGAKGGTGSSAPAGAAGGAAASGTGASKNSGGTGGNGQATNGAGGGGGGGAGFGGDGGAGTNGASGSGGDGGQGGNGGGAGATTNGGTGGNGSVSDNPTGGGGGGGGGGTPSAGGLGGNYGGGGGGGGTSSSSGAAGGSGSAGVMRISYTPEGIRFNMPMLGM